MFMQPLLALGVAVPTPGGAGSYHAAVNFGLALFGVSWATAAGAGIILHGVDHDSDHFARADPARDRGNLIQGLAAGGPAVSGARWIVGWRSTGCDPSGDGEPAVKCPFCAHDKDKVVDSRESQAGDAIRRRRECLECGRRFTSYERIDEIPYFVVKKGWSPGGIRSEQALRRAAPRPVEKRPVSARALAEIVEQVEQMVQDSAEREVDAAAIGEKVMDRLKELDKVAYVRFASVYREFEDVAGVS